MKHSSCTKVPADNEKVSKVHNVHSTMSGICDGLECEAGEEIVALEGVLSGVCGSKSASSDKRKGNIRGEQLHIGTRVEPEEL